MNRALLAVILSFAIFTAPWIGNAQLAEPDRDNDGLTDQQEMGYRTDLDSSDTDGDGFSDGDEVLNGFSPLLKEKALREVDSDGDGAWDDWEMALGTNLFEKDTDGDGFSDGQEIMAGFDPNHAKTNTIGKRIDVDLETQTLRYYLGPVKIDEFKISSGLPGTPTPKGSYSIILKRPVVRYAGVGYDYPQTKWNLMFKRGTTGNYYIHGAYWHNDFGKKKSHGCVNVPHRFSYMGRLYDWATDGTPVTIH